jgi:hypothetical protein
MPLAVAVGVQVPERGRAELLSWTRSPSLRAGLAQRARVVLLAADGVGTTEIVGRVGLSKPAVIGWKRRYAAEGIAGLDDRAKFGATTGDRPGRGRLGYARAGPGESGGDALVEPVAGQVPGGQ